MDAARRLRLIMVLGLRWKDGRGLVRVMLLHMRLRAGRRLERSRTSALGRCLITALQVRMGGMLLVLWRIFHHECEFWCRGLFSQR